MFIIFSNEKKMKSDSIHCRRVKFVVINSKSLRKSLIYQPVLVSHKIQFSLFIFVQILIYGSHNSWYLDCRSDNFLLCKDFNFSFWPIITFLIFFHISWLRFKLCNIYHQSQNSDNPNHFR